MAYTIRKATPKDAGIIAHMMLVWDAELPKHLQMLNGDAPHAETTAKAMTTNPEFITEVVEEDGKIVGMYVVSKIEGLFCSKPYGILNVMVYPKYRGGKMYGLRLLERSIKAAKEAGLAWLESCPWADAHGMHFVLERLGFNFMSRGYALRF
jgi:N-acetylglutamate synthase-like GNAT family acetyltransferase